MTTTTTITNAWHGHSHCAMTGTVRLKWRAVSCKWRKRSGHCIEYRIRLGSDRWVQVFRLRQTWQRSGSEICLTLMLLQSPNAVGTFPAKNEPQEKAPRNVPSSHPSNAGALKRGL